ncbi:glutathione S-transferase family protein [Reyranella sp. CPCC 100927]|uniref:glutathione S-transferase family protein n=1 Tax=Reyranella sp. CPCC 100927 TaxID=2599616 RepID=UPI0011B6597D|nr:glutathione S-transferase family protein [Reyranella sp. CPCC 100927]TWT15305.1 glutathione S-transferase family protein [Reyranella sp. CPCC 100927]
MTLRLHHNLFSASSQKVRLALAEKHIAWESVEVDLQAGQQHTPAYRALNPRGVVPTLVHNDAILIESAAILEYLDDVFPEPALRPVDPVARQRMRAWIRRLDDVHHPANGMMHYAVLGRPTLRALSSDRLSALLQAMPNRRDRTLRAAAAHLGVDAPEFADAVLTQEEMLDAMNDALTGSACLVGDTVSLADLTALPYVARLEQMGLAVLIESAGRQALADWYGRMKRRASWQTAIGVLPAPVVERWQALGRQAWPQVAMHLRRRPSSPPG